MLSSYIVEFRSTQGAMVRNATSTQGLKLAIHIRLISAEPAVANHLMWLADGRCRRREGSGKLDFNIPDAFFFSWELSRSQRSRFTTLSLLKQGAVRRNS